MRSRSCILVILISLCGVLPLASAQRGERYVVQEPIVTEDSATRGFPGLFDTEMLGKGHVSADLPLSSIDFGITDNFNVGAYALYSLSTLGGTPAAALKARYLIHRSARWSVVGNGFVTFFIDPSEGEGVKNLYSTWASINAEFGLNEKHRFGGSFVFVSLFGESEDGGLPQKIVFSSTVLGLRHQYSFSSKFAFETLLLLAPTTRADLDSVSATASANLSGDITRPHERFGLRMLAHWRPSKKWLFQFGGIVLRGGRDVLPLPWLSVGRYW